MSVLIIPSSETLQSIILANLEFKSIQDSRNLPFQLASTNEQNEFLPTLLAGPGAEEQNAIRSALDALTVREVS